MCWERDGGARRRVQDRSGLCPREVHHRRWRGLLAIQNPARDEARGEASDGHSAHVRAWLHAWDGRRRVALQGRIRTCSESQPACFANLQLCLGAMLLATSFFFACDDNRVLILPIFFGHLLRDSRLCLLARWRENDFATLFFIATAIERERERISML